MTKTILICTFMLLVTQYALADSSVKAGPFDSVVTATEVKTEQKKEAEAEKKPVVAEKSKEEEYKAQLESGTKIQGEGPFVVNAEQLPQDARDEVMKLLNTQYRLSQEKKAQQQNQQREQEESDQIAPEFKIENQPSVSEDESFDPELASGIAELLSRMAVEDEEGNQYLDLGELPVELRTEVANYLTKQQQVADELAMEDLIKEQMKAEAEEDSKSVTSPAAVAALVNKHQPSGSQLGGVLGSLIGGAVGGYPAYGGGYYPGANYGSYGGYPNQHYGGYPQYGGQYGGYPGGGHHHHHHHGYGYSAYPAVGQSYGSRPQRPQGIVVNREQLASLLASDPSLAAYVVPIGTGSMMPGYHFAQQPSFTRQPKPQQPFNLPANPFAAYYHQLLKSQQSQPIAVGSKYAQQASRFRPEAFNKQQPRPFGYYPKPAVAQQFRRFPNQYRF